MVKNIDPPGTEGWRIHCVVQGLLATVNLSSTAISCPGVLLNFNLMGASCLFTKTTAEASPLGSNDLPNHGVWTRFTVSDMISLCRIGFRSSEQTWPPLHLLAHLTWAVSCVVCTMRASQWGGSSQPQLYFSIFCNQDVWYLQRYGLIIKFR